MSSPSDSPELDESVIQQQLGEKDQLIRALTDQLEEAAEQLDRVKRSGTDKGRKGGPPSDLAAQQQSLLQQLNKSVELWDDVKPKEAFERIEERLDELLELLQTSRGGEPAPRQEKENPLAGWEKMKAQLMGETAPRAATPSTAANSSPASGSAPAPAAPAATSQEQAQAAPQELAGYERSPQPLDELELPVPLDFDLSTREELEEGIETRDQYINYLTRRLRSAESQVHRQIDWNALNNAPERLVQSLENLEADLNDRLRIAEVDLSLERARLSRVETRIRTMQQQIERKLHSVGRPAGGDTPPPSDGKQKQSTGKGWFGSSKR